MNHTTDNHDSGFGKAMDIVARAFEKRWHQDHSLVVEQFLGSIDSLLKPLGIDATIPETLNAFRKELIHLEMDLRCAHGHPVEPAEYYERFPDNPNAVEEALERVRRLYPHCFRGSVLRTTDTRVGEGSGSGDSFWNFEAVGHSSVPAELGPYRAITYIGSGGFGDVYKAIDTRCGELVALKFPRYRPDSTSNVMDEVKAEAQMAMRLKHSGIIATRAIENIDSFAFIVQDFVQGMNLKMFMEGPDLEQREIGMLVAQIADALAYAHREGIIHRDIKPQNILMDRSGKPFVADFGLAIYSSQRYATIGQPVCGTKFYFSPEVVSGRMYQVGGFYDVWCLGIIFYQLLTGERPFGGPNDRILFEEIVQKDPEPPHVLNHRVDPELDRLCLQCLEKKPGRRLTARKLADSLQAWLKQPINKKRAGEGTDSPAPKFVPRGLHSYTAKDAPFFLPLLPGPRDEHGIPASIRFWRDRILEPVAEEDRVPVGVIYGPSGSGKSSYVKAGLIPLIDHQVRCVYVEATHKDTDVRLLKALRNEFDIPPGQSSLPEIFAGLRDGKWQRESGKKTLICLDQFEQRLSAVGEFDPTELINALRHCDGENLQCLLLVRDDFLMSMSRFSDALEMDLREGQNTQIVDLFDRKHAQKVLTLLGHAYDRLSSDNIANLTKEEINFVNRAVDDQVEDQHVICVRLTVFAEMFKNQAWSVENLQEAGSVTGVGVQFLDRELGPQNRKVPHQAVFRLLCSLLPAAGTDIRGSMKSEAELANAAGLPVDSSGFRKVISLLDNELRLITRTDPDVSGVVEIDKDKSKPADRYYQLTHDYLVPSIRAWQDKWLGGTRRGRAELRLQRLASEVVLGKQPENLPTHLEWLAWQVLLRRHRFTASEQVVMQSARGRFFKDASLSAAVIMLLGGLISWAVIKRNRDHQAAQIVDNLLNQNFDALPKIASLLPSYQSRVVPMLGEHLATGNEELRHRALLGMVVIDPQAGPREIVDIMTAPDCPPDKLSAFSAVIAVNGLEISQALTAVANDLGADPKTRFRAICADLLINEGNVDLSDYGNLVAKVLLDEPVTTTDRWIAVLSGAANQLKPNIIDLLSICENRSEAQILAHALFSFETGKNRLPTFSSMVISANAERFDAILSTIEQQGKTVPFLEKLHELYIQTVDATGRANLATAMARLGNEERLLELFGAALDERETLIAINFSASPRLRLHTLRRIFDNLDLDAPSCLNQRRSVLQAIALHADGLLENEQKSWMLQIAHDRILSDGDPCCYATSELIVRLVEPRRLPELRELRRNGDAKQIVGRVMLNSQLQPFSIVEIQSPNGGILQIAISMYETTIGDVNAVSASVGIPKEGIENQPFEFGEHILDVIEYANQLSKNDGLEAFYGGVTTLEHLINTTYNVETPGYRLPTFNEWSIACQSNKVLEGGAMEGGAFGRNPLQTRYAWLYENSDIKEHDVGLLLPNSNGLFDSFGNVQELCHTLRTEHPWFVEAGMSWRTDADSLTLDKSFPHSIRNPTQTSLGFRLVQTIK